MTIRKYFTNFKNSSKEFLAYKSNFFIQLLFLFFILFVTYSLWKVIYAQNNFSSGEFAQLIWYLFFTRAISMCLSDVYKDIISEIRSGRIALLVNKPYNFIIFKLFGSFGKSALPNFIAIIATTIFGFILIGSFFVNISATGIILSLILIFNAILIDWFIKFIISILSFWMGEVRGVLLVYQRLLMFLGGVMIPFDILPGWLKAVGKYLPTNFILNQPAKILVNFNYYGFGQAFLGQIVYISCLFLISSIIYKIGVKHLNVNGG